MKNTVYQKPDIFILNLLPSKELAGSNILSTLDPSLDENQDNDGTWPWG